MSKTKTAAKKPNSKAGKVAQKPAAKAGTKSNSAAAKPKAKATSVTKKATTAKKTAAKKAPAPKKAATAKKAAPAKKASSPKPTKAKKPVVAKKARAEKPAPAAKAKAEAKPKAAAKTKKKSGGPAITDLKPGAPTASGAIYYDSHMHTPLCKHAWGEPEEYAEQGVQSGLKGIIFTCHCPMPDGFWPIVRMANSEFDTYLKVVERTREAYAGKLDVLLGIESEFYPGCEEWITELHKRADFDYILGGLHWQAKEYLGKYETGTIELFRRTYFDHLAGAAESGLYDCLAHPDLVKNYHPDSWCFAIVKPSIASALDRIAKTGVAMELNTSGLNKSYPEMNPGFEMLQMMAERNIPIVIGSDAHRPHRVGEQFVTALIQLQEAGYEKVCYFKQRQRIDLPISKVLASIKKASDAHA